MKNVLKIVFEKCFFFFIYFQRFFQKSFFFSRFLKVFVRMAPKFPLFFLFSSDFYVVIKKDTWQQAVSPRGTSCWNMESTFQEDLHKRFREEDGQKPFKSPFSYWWSISTLVCHLTTLQMFFQADPSGILYNTVNIDGNRVFSCFLLNLNNFCVKKPKLPY